MKVDFLAIFAKSIFAAAVRVFCGKILFLIFERFQYHKILKHTLANNVSIQFRIKRILNDSYFI